MNKTHGSRFKVLSKAREVESEVGGNDGVSRLEDNGLRNKMKVSNGGIRRKLNLLLERNDE